MSAIDDRIILKFICPKCHNTFSKLPSWLKPGGAVICTNCGKEFIDEAVLKAAKDFSERCKTLGILKQ